MTAQQIHVLSIDSGFPEGGYTPHCDCGWMGQLRDSMQEAADEWGRHWIRKWDEAVANAGRDGAVAMGRLSGLAEKKWLRPCEACAGIGEWGPQYGEPAQDCPTCHGSGMVKEKQI